MCVFTLFVRGNEAGSCATAWCTEIEKSDLLSRLTMLDRCCVCFSISLFFLV